MKFFGARKDVAAVAVAAVVAAAVAAAAEWIYCGCALDVGAMELILLGVSLELQSGA